MKTKNIFWLLWFLDSQVEEEESDEDTESDEMETRMDKYNDRLRHHDNTLNTLKKGNYLLKSKVDMAQEELRKERSRYSALEIELNNCLAELGWDWKIKSISKYIIHTLYIKKNNWK